MPKRSKPYTRQPAPVAQNQPVAMDAGLALRRAADKARESMAAKSYQLSAPVLPKGVVPEGEMPAVAMDSCADIYAYAQQGCNGAGFQPFPGYPYLAQLATRPEYRAFADAMAGELTREWISVDGANGGDDDPKSDANQDNERIEELTKAIDRLGLKNVFKLAAQHDCFFGRAQIAITLKNQDPSLPLVLSPNTVPKGSLERFACVEPMWSTPNEYNAIDPTAPDFYKPRSWFVLGKKYHASRLLTIISRPLPDMLKPAYNFSGMSLSQLAERYVDNWLRTRQSISDLVNNFSITALKTNMQNVLTGGCDGSDLAARADLFTLYRSNKGLMLLDQEGEELVQLNTPLSGLSDLQGQALEQLCVVSRMPAMILTGISPSGLNASSEGEIRVFYDWISSLQESVWKEALDTCIKVIQLDLWGEIDPTITWKYNPLWQVTAKEQSEIRLNNANADATYVDRGILSPEEVRERLSADPDSDYAGIDVSEVPFVDEGTDPDAELEAALGLPGADKSVSEAQRKAMQAAAHGESTLGIPASVGKEFAKEDAKQ